MRAEYRLSFVLVIASCVAPPSIRAQSTAEVHTESGLHRVLFHVPQGIIRVNYPDDMAVGDTISGTVYTEPLGKTQKEQDKNSGELSGYVIEKEGQKTPASEKRFRWWPDTRPRSHRSFRQRPSRPHRSGREPWC